MSAASEVPHPGTLIRAKVIPTGMSVTKAAQIMAVGRPALSNLLNGNAALSPEMAGRLQKAFNYPLDELMEMQARYDSSRARAKVTPTSTQAYVPSFLPIKANDIETWASHNIPARSRFAVLLRTLVHSTGNRLTKVDFPGNDDAERPGWDGFVESSEANAWVPDGRSGWEFGTNEDPKTKANGDFDKSVKAHDKTERAGTTFIFVTPRRWPGKNAWLQTQQAKGLWKDVRAYDASDLEQWLEQSLPAQTWFANEAHLPAQHVRSLDRCWFDWAGGTSPLTGALFSAAIDSTKAKVLSRLSKAAEGPIIIAADSTEEGLAFLAQLMSERGGEELATLRDRVLVFDGPGVLPKLAAGAQTFIPVVFTREVERELAPHASTTPSFVIYPRNVPRGEADIVLEPLKYETFTKALEQAGLDRDEISRLANASGRSLTVLRRQLSLVPAVRTPIWATDHKTAISLVPYLLVGAWNSQNEADQLGLSLMADNRPYDELERELQSLTQLNDSPVWSVGTYRGVISKIDLLYAIAGAVTKQDLKRYFDMARMVLGEDDPALDLEESERWAASIHGKTREFSAAFRDGISEMLVLLAVHGKSLFQSRLGIDPEVDTTQVVRDLLPTPLNTRILEANDDDLPTYAEAAPDEFLSVLERDLKSDSPATLSLMRPAAAGVFGAGPSRTGLLWALEGLSWSSATLPRAALILARLATVEINDNWVNKPARSLESIFSARMPQTAAGHQQRIDLLKKIADKFSLVAWKVCVAQFDTHHWVGNYSHKPRWRPDGDGYGEPFTTWDPIIKFTREMVEMALSWKEHSLEMLTDLVDRLDGLANADQSRVWSLIEAWAKKANDADRATLREKIRVSILSRRAAMRSKKKNEEPAGELAAAARAAHAALEPSDLFNKHAWLFRDSWIEESADENQDDDFDYSKHEERINKLRSTALREVFEQRGLGGLLEFSVRGNTAWVIGALLAIDVLSEQELHELMKLALLRVFAKTEPFHAYKNLVAGALRALTDDEKRERALKSVLAGLNDEKDIAQVLVLAPFRKSTWKLVDTESDEVQSIYWTEVSPDWIHTSEIENNEAVERLLKAGRPRAAFSCIHLVIEKTDTQVLFRVLSAIAQGGGEPTEHHRIDQYHIERAFKRLDGDSMLTVEQKAGLEFAFVDALARPWDSRDKVYGIPNLETFVALHPELFVQAIAWTFKRRDGGVDPAEMQIPEDRRRTMAQRGHKLLDALKRIPGHNETGDIDAGHLRRWIARVRQLSAELSRSEVADISIGHVLSSAPIGVDGVWPCEQVRDVMEEVQSEAIMRGAHHGVFNSRGVHWRGEGGDQERALADKYRKWAQALQVSHPFVSSSLLMELAKTYDHDASREDTEAGIRRRLR